MSAVAILLNCGSIVLFTLSTIVSSSILILIINRFTFNVHHRRQPDRRYPTVLSDDNISLLLIGNTYLIILLYSLTWISLLLRTFLGDFNIVNDRFYLGDSTVCRIQVGCIFFLTSALYQSFLVHACSRYLKVIHSTQLESITIGPMSLNGIGFHQLMILLSWIVSLLVLLPAYTTFHVFSYIPEQYHCLITFNNFRGFAYALLSCYLAPMFPIVCVYTKMIQFLDKLPRCGILLQPLRHLAVKRRTLNSCILISLLGWPTLFFLGQFLFTRKLHSIVDRIHSFGLAINSLIFIFGYAFLHSLGQLLPSSPSLYERTSTRHPNPSNS